VTNPADLLRPLLRRHCCRTLRLIAHLIRAALHAGGGHRHTPLQCRRRRHRRRAPGGRSSTVSRCGCRRHWSVPTRIGCLPNPAQSPLTHQSYCWLNGCACVCVCVCASFAFVCVAVVGEAGEEAAAGDRSSHCTRRFRTVKGTKHNSSEGQICQKCYDESRRGPPSSASAPPVAYGPVRSHKKAASATAAALVGPSPRQAVKTTYTPASFSSAAAGQRLHRHSSLNCARWRRARDADSQGAHALCLTTLSLCATWLRIRRLDSRSTSQSMLSQQRISRLLALFVLLPLHFSPPARCSSPPPRIAAGAILLIRCIRHQSRPWKPSSSSIVASSLSNPPTCTNRQPLCALLCASS